MANVNEGAHKRSIWDKGRVVGQKPSLKLREIRALRVRLEITNHHRDLVKLKVRDVAQGTNFLKRAMVIQQKTLQPVKFEITQQPRDSLTTWIELRKLTSGDYLFPSRSHHCAHLSTRQYARIVKSWVAQIGLHPADYETHSLRRTKATLIYKRTKNLRAIQLLLGHTQLESTVRYRGIEVDDALELAEQTEI